MRISDWSSDVCSSDLANLGVLAKKKLARRCVEEPAELASMPPSIRAYRQPTVGLRAQDRPHGLKPKLSAVIGRSTQIEAIRDPTAAGLRSEEHKSELQSLMRNSYTVFRLKKKKNKQQTT